MANRPLDTLTPAYRKRIERALAQGKTRQSARGHKAKEHVERKQREIKEGKFTSHQRQEITKFSKEQAKRSGVDWQTTREDLEKFIKGDYKHFKELKEQRNKLVKSYKHNHEAGRKEFDALYKSMTVPQQNEYWFYYH